MEAAAATDRRSKRGIIHDDDDSSSGQPSMKSAKRETEPGSASSRDVVELPQRALKMDDFEFDDLCTVSSVVEPASADSQDSKVGILAGSNPGNDLQNRLAEMEIQLKEAEEIRKDAQLNELKVKIERDNIDYQLLQREKQDLELEKEAAERRVKDLKSKRKELTQMFNDLEKDNAALREELNEAKRKAEDANNKIEVISRENNTNKEKLNRALNKLKIANDANVELTQENETLKEESDLVKRKADHANNKIEQLTRDISTMKTESKRREAIASKSNGEQMQKNAILNREVVSFSAEWKEAKRKAEDANAKIDELTQENTILKDRVASLEEESDKLKREARQTKMKNEQLNSLNNESARNEEVARNANEKLKIKIATLKAELEEARKKSEKELEEEGDVSCICGEKEDDGEAMVQCNKCKTWYHVACLFPTTLEAPAVYFCHVCKPRSTELTSEQARAYQEKLKALKAEIKEQGEKNKKGEEKRKKEEKASKQQNARKSCSARKKSVGTANSSYQGIRKNEYSDNARKLLPGLSLPSDQIALRSLQYNRRVLSSDVAPNVRGLFAKWEIADGDYAAKLLGKVTLQNECASRSLVSGSLNDHTFLIEKEMLGLRIPDNLIVDARLRGNYARDLRRSCKPNAELVAIITGLELYIMVKTTKLVAKGEEVSIKLEDDWQKQPKPAQGCACKEKATCEVERFFNQSKKASVAVTPELSDSEED